MKKALSILLAITMLFAVCVPAFAVDKVIDQNTDQSVPGNVGAQLTTAIPQDIIDKGGYYSLTFPAETVIPWSTAPQGSSTDLACTIYTNLIEKNTLSVSVTAADDSKDASGNFILKNAANKSIVFTLADTNLTQGAFVNPTTPNWIPSVKITKEAWDAAPLGNDYVAHLTFTATVNKAA